MAEISLKPLSRFPGPPLRVDPRPVDASGDPQPALAARQPPSRPWPPRCADSRSSRRSRRFLTRGRQALGQGVHLARAAPGKLAHTLHGSSQRGELAALKLDLREHRAERRALFTCRADQFLQFGHLLLGGRLAVAPPRASSITLSLEDRQTAPPGSRDFTGA